MWSSGHLGIWSSGWWWSGVLVGATRGPTGAVWILIGVLPRYLGEHIGSGCRVPLASLRLQARGCRAHDLSTFRALKFTVRRHNFNKDYLAGVLMGATRGPTGAVWIVRQPLPPPPLLTDPPRQDGWLTR